MAQHLRGSDAVKLKKDMAWLRRTHHLAAAATRLVFPAPCLMEGRFLFNAALMVRKIAKEDAAESDGTSIFFLHPHLDFSLALDIFEALAEEAGPRGKVEKLRPRTLMEKYSSLPLRNLC